MKKFFSICCLLCVGFMAFASGSKDAKTNVRVVVPKGGPAISMAKMINSEVNIDGLKTEYELVDGPNLLTARLASGEADIAIVASNLAANLYSKNKSLVIAGGVTWGNLYLISNRTFKDISELKGQTIISFGRNSSPDIVLAEILNSSGFKADDIKIEYRNSVTDVAPEFISGKAQIALVAEPVLSMILSKKPETVVLLDLQKEWKEKISGTDLYPQAALVIKKDFVKKNPKYVKAFIKIFAESIDWVNANPKEAGVKYNAIAKAPPAPIIAKSIKGLNLQWKAIADSKPDFEKYFSILLKSNPKFAGGNLPDEEFYYTAK